MKRLWAPWRKEYVSKKNKEEECFFCAKHRLKKDKDNFVITRSTYSFSMLNAFPYSNGHILAAPYRHVGNIAELPEPELIDLIKLVVSSQALLKKSLSPHGYNIGINTGKAAGAGVTEHIHIHIVPRWEGDTNFMPVISGAKVIPESLESVYDALIRAEKREA